jgi:hypothetical protein
MAQPSPVETGWCAVDNTFGPGATACRGGFDFTLLFEESILSILPSALFLLIVPNRLLHVCRGSKKVRRSTLQILKLASLRYVPPTFNMILMNWVPGQRNCISLSADRATCSMGEAWPFENSAISSGRNICCPRCCSDWAYVIFLSQSLRPSVYHPASLPIYHPAI